MALEVLVHGANLGIGVFLAALAALVYRYSPHRATRGPLALFLSLVAANYALDGLAWTAPLLGAPEARDPMLFAALTAVFVDPPAFLLFALSVAGRRPARTGQILLFLPGLALLALYLSAPVPFMASWTWNRLYLAELATFYVAAYAVLVRAWLREARAVERDRLAVLVTAFGVVVLPRLALLLADAGIAAPRSIVAAPQTTLLLLATLAATVAVATALVFANAPATAREHVTRTWAATLGLVGAVAACWTLALVPSLRTAALSLLYSLRWFLFAAVLSVGVRRFDLLGLDERARRRLRGGFAAAVLALGFVELSVVLAAVPDAEPLGTLLASAAVVGLVAAAYGALRRAVPDADPRQAWGRLDVYRAHLELGAAPGEMEDVRERLGLSPEEAAAAASAAAAPSRADLAEGGILAGRFEIRGFLGAGAFGRAFVGWDRQRGESVVLKELLPAWRGDAEAVARFRGEAATALAIDHPNLVAFRALERVAGGHVLVLAHVEGETLRARLARGPLAPAEARALAGDLLAGLAALHAAGILHRDVKPENVVLRPDGRAVLLDFGAAAALAGATVLAGGRAHAGTPAYMSPEQARGGALGPASDVYAVGALLWEALAAAPHPQGALPEAWDAVVARALADDPAARWPTAEAMRAALPP